MWKLKKSPRTLKATEKYITSLGRKREELTEEQWNLMVKYVEGRRLAVPILMIFFLFTTVMAFLWWHFGHEYFTKSLPLQTVTISFEDKREPISLSPKEMKKYFDYVTECYMHVGAQSMIAIVLLTFVIGNLTVTRAINRKTHRILLSRSTNSEVAR